MRNGLAWAVIVVCVLLALLMGWGGRLGAGDGPPGKTIAGPDVFITGVVFHNGADYQHLDLSPGASQGIRLTPGDTLTTKHALVLSVKRTPTAAPFTLLFGPDRAVSDEVGSGTLPTGSTENVFVLTSGWTYLRGEMPVAETTRSRAVANGTVFLMRIDADNNLDEIAYLDAGASTRLDTFRKKGAGGPHVLETLFAANEIGDYVRVADGSDDKPEKRGKANANSDLSGVIAQAEASWAASTQPSFRPAP